jgi:hypothetical protein
VAERETHTPGQSVPAARTDPLRWGRRFFVGVLAASIIGAAILIVSITRDPAMASQLSPPRYVLVAVVGTSAEPGFAGFLVHIPPNQRTVGVIPVPGTLPSGVHNEQLWVAADKMTGAQFVRAIYKDTHIRAGGYFLIREPAANTLFGLLSADSQSWPASLQDPPYNPGVPLALYKLGWWPPSVAPVVVSTRSGDLKVLTDIMGDLQDLPAGAVGQLSAQILAGKPTNLALSQLFTLGIAIRGDNLQMEPLYGGRR